MSNDLHINELLVKIKDNISPNKLEEFASIAIEKMSSDGWIGDLLVGIKDNISEDQLNNLRNQINPETPKACCTIM